MTEPSQTCSDCPKPRALLFDDPEFGQVPLCMGCFIDDKLRAEVTVNIAEQGSNNRANRLTVEVCA